MCSFHVVAFICLVAAASFANSNAQEFEGASEEHSLDELHAELAEQLMMAEHAGLAGEELADRLEYHSRQLNEVERHIVEQLLEEQQASLTGQELGRMLTEEHYLQERGVGGSCSVNGLTAKCCGGASFKVIFKRIEFQVCVQVEFLPAEYGLQLSFSYNGANFFEKKVSVGNANGICANVPKLKSVSACLKLTDVQQEGGHFKGCIGIQPKAFGLSLPTISMGCISL